MSKAGLEIGDENEIKFVPLQAICSILGLLL